MPALLNHGNGQGQSFDGRIGSHHFRNRSSWLTLAIFPGLSVRLFVSVKSTR